MGSVRRGGRAVAASVLVFGLAVGCSHGAATQDDLEHVLVESRSALVAARMALDMLERGRTTSAAATTAVEDMSQQVFDAARALEEVSVGSSGEQTDRDAALLAVNSGGAALLAVRDELTLDGRANQAGLTAATVQVERALGQIRARR